MEQLILSAIRAKHGYKGRVVWIACADEHLDYIKETEGGYLELPEGPDVYQCPLLFAVREWSALIKRAGGIGNMRHVHVPAIAAEVFYRRRR